MGRKSPDYVLILAVVGLSRVGLLMVYSTTIQWGYLGGGDSFRLVRRQALWFILGGGMAFALTQVDYRHWKRLAVPMLAGTLLLLLLSLVVGDLMWGARRALVSGSVQPGELAKLITVLYAATWVASKGEQIRDVTYGLVPFSVWMGVVAGLVILQPDLSAAAILVLTGFVIFFLGGAHLGQMVVASLIGTVVFIGLIALYPYAWKRLVEFINGLSDPSKLGYHPRQALYALGSGRVMGVGLGHGRAKFGYLPLAHSDTIFAALGEELGLIGCLLIVALFVLLVWRGFRIAIRARDRFGGLLAGGLTCMLAFQAVLNVGAVTSLLPFTGTTLPFVSLGGSSLLVCMAAVGMLLSISRGPAPGKWRGDAGLDRGRRNGGTRLSRSGRPAGA